MDKELLSIIRNKKLQLVIAFIILLSGIKNKNYDQEQQTKN